MARRKGKVRKGIAGKYAKNQLAKAFRAGEITQNQYDRLREQLGDTRFGFVRKQRKAGKISKDKIKNIRGKVKNTLDQGKGLKALKPFQDLLFALEESKSKNQERKNTKQAASAQPAGGGTRFDSNPAKEFYEQQQAAKNEAFNALVGQQQSQPIAQPVASQPATQPVASQPATQPVASQPVTQPVASQPVTQPVASQSAAQPVDKYQQTLSELKGSFEAGNIDESEYKRLRGELAQDRFGPKADMSQFNELLSKLEGSKMRQQRQRSVEGRRDIFAGGLANMMSNF